MPFQKRYIMVDTAGARLYMIDDGRIVDSMKVIVGKADPSTPDSDARQHHLLHDAQPLLARVVDMVRSLIAKNVLEKGLSYLKTRGYQVMPADPRAEYAARSGQGRLACGRRGPRNGPGAAAAGARQLDGPDQDRLSRTPTTSTCTTRPTKCCSRKTTATSATAASGSRMPSGSGAGCCGRDPATASREPEQNVLLPTPVPIYITYVTAQRRRTAS